MSWPSPQDYNEAVQAPLTSFSDEELRRGEPALTPLGLPKPISGNFATVYQLKCGTRNWAVRCFLKDVKDQQRRYEAINDHLRRAMLPSMVRFEFLAKGIRVRGKWYPILKMEWINGESLEAYLTRSWSNAAALKSLAAKWLDVLAGLRIAQIAHGDLQHSNVLVSGGEIKLIDYDGVFVPSLAGLTSNEDGHRNYQHPGRTGSNFGLYLDSFPGWVILVSILAVAEDPTLWNRLNGGDDCLLFRERDFRQPNQSRAFSALASIRNSALAEMVEDIRRFLGLPLGAIPAPASTRGLPEWLEGQNRSRLVEEPRKQKVAPGQRKPRVGPAANIATPPEIVLDPSLLDGKRVRIRGSYGSRGRVQQGDCDIFLNGDRLPERQQKLIRRLRERGCEMMVVDGTLKWDICKPRDSEVIAEHLVCASPSTDWRELQWSLESPLPELVLDPHCFSGHRVRMRGVYHRLYRTGNSFVLRQGIRGTWVVYSELPSARIGRILAETLVKGRDVIVDGILRCENANSDPELIASKVVFKRLKKGEPFGKSVDNDKHFYPWDHVTASREDRVLQASQAEQRREVEESLRAACCPDCGRRGDELSSFYFSSPPITWEWECGRAGWMVVCDACRRQVRFDLTVMN